MNARPDRGPERAALLIAVFALVCSISITAQQRPKNVREGAFTADQAASGKAGFDGVCLRCHGATLGGSEGNGPPLKGGTFLAHWDKDTLGSLWVKIRDTMPLGVPGTLTDEVKLQILAYVLQQNGFPAGTVALPMDVSALDEINIQVRGVWDGVFSAAQADRGATPVARCRGCHGPQLTGTDRAPALKGAGFLANWEDGSVNRLFTKIRDTMPPGNTDSLSPETKLDVLAYLLRENDFPTGPTDLALNTDALDALQITRKNGDTGAPNFSLVQVVGCLTRDASSGWKLMSATDPVVVRDGVPNAAALKNAEARALGRQTFGLVSLDAGTKGGALDGHKVEARGLLYRDGSYADLNLTSIKNVAPTCAR